MFSVPSLEKCFISKHSNLRVASCILGWDAGNYGNNGLSAACQQQKVLKWTWHQETLDNRLMAVFLNCNIRPELESDSRGKDWEVTGFQMIVLGRLGCPLISDRTHTSFQGRQETLSLSEQTEVVWASFLDVFHVSHVHGRRCQDTLGRLCPSTGLYSVIWKAMSTLTASIGIKRVNSRQGLLMKWSWSAD